MCQEPRVLHTFEKEVQIQEGLSLSHFPCTSIQGTPCFCCDSPPDSRSTDMLDVLFSYRLLVFENKEKLLKTEPESSQHLQPLPQAEGHCTSPCQGAQQVLDCLPLSQLPSFSCLLPQAHLHACTCSPPFQEFYYCFQDRREVKPNSARSLEQSKKGWKLNSWEWKQAVKCKQNETHGWASGQDCRWGVCLPTGLRPYHPPHGHHPWLTFSKLQPLCASASLPWSIKRSSCAQLCLVPHLALPFAPTHSEWCPATTAAMFCTHMTVTTGGSGRSTIACQVGPCLLLASEQSPLAFNTSLLSALLTCFSLWRVPSDNI